MTDPVLPNPREEHLRERDRAAGMDPQSIADSRDRGEQERRDRLDDHTPAGELSARTPYPPTPTRGTA